MLHSTVFIKTALAGSLAGSVADRSFHCNIYIYITGEEGGVLDESADQAAEAGGNGRGRYILCIAEESCSGREGAAGGSSHLGA